MDGVKYSVVIPMYKSEKTIRAVVEEVVGEFARIDISEYEIVLVNDCSPDNVLNVAIDISRDNRCVRVADLAKNVGQTNACLAGYALARGDYIICMDDDMQTPGTEIGNLIDAIIERDDDIVFARYTEEGTHRPLLRKVGTWVNAKMATIAIGKPRNIETNSFLIMKRFVADALLCYSGHFVYAFGVMFATTSKVSNLTMNHRDRAFGKSGYTLRKLISLWVSGLLGFSLLPLRGMLCIGLLGLLLSALFVVGGIASGAIETTLVISVDLLCAGVLGEYLGRILLGNSTLPKYTIRKTYMADDDGMESSRSR